MYKRQVNTVTVFYMGSSGGHTDPFSPDGTSIDPDVLRRMDAVIDAARARKMVVIVGIFYQRPAPRLRDWSACIEAVRTVTRHHRDRGDDNIILNIANEHSSARYSDKTWSRVRNVSDLIALCDVVHQVDPDRLVGAGGYEHDKNRLLIDSPSVDLLLFDTYGGEHSWVLYDGLLSEGRATKPVVNVEYFGGWTIDFGTGNPYPQGVFPAFAQQAYFDEVDYMAAQPGLFGFFHSDHWCQGPGTGYPLRFDLAGQGSSSDPGIRWYFQYVRQTRPALARTVLSPW